MEAGIPAEDSQILAIASEDVAVLTTDEFESFENLFDIPFVTVNRVDGEIQAEVILSGHALVDLDRIQCALEVGAENGVSAYARVHGEFNTVLIYFMEDEMGVLSSAA